MRREESDSENSAPDDQLLDDVGRLKMNKLQWSADLVDTMIMAIVGPMISGVRYDAELAAMNERPVQSLVGTDALGRDLFTASGMGRDFVDTASAAVIDFTIGVLYGGTPASSKEVDAIMMRIANY